MDYSSAPTSQNLAARESYSTQDPFSDTSSFYRAYFGITTDGLLREQAVDEVSIPTYKANQEDRASFVNLSLELASYEKTLSRGN